VHVFLGNTIKEREESEKREKSFINKSQSKRFCWKKNTQKYKKRLQRFKKEKCINTFYKGK